MHSVPAMRIGVLAVGLWLVLLTTHAGAHVHSNPDGAAVCAAMCAPPHAAHAGAPAPVEWWAPADIAHNRTVHRQCAARRRAIRDDGAPERAGPMRTTRAQGSCPSTTHATTDTLNIFSTNVGGGEYAPDVRCSWFIRAADENACVRLLVSGESEYQYDTLSIFDGNMAELGPTDRVPPLLPQGEPLSGSLREQEVVSSGRDLTVTFESDSFEEYFGFTILVEETRGCAEYGGDLFCAGDYTLTEREGAFRTSATNTYIAEMSCRWFIAPPEAAQEDKCIDLFVRVNTLRAGGMLAIFDGPHLTDPLLPFGARIRGRHVPEFRVQTHGPTARLDFTSGDIGFTDHVVPAGVQVRYNVTECGSYEPLPQCTDELVHVSLREDEHTPVTLFPHTVSTPHTKCTVVLHAPVGMCVHLALLDIDLRGDSYVEAWDGDVGSYLLPDGRSYEAGDSLTSLRHAGRNEVRTSGRTLTLTSTTFASTAAGYVFSSLAHASDECADPAARPPPSCERVNAVITTSGATVSVPPVIVWDETYTSNLECEWHVLAPEGMCVAMTTAGEWRLPSPTSDTPGALDHVEVVDSSGVLLPEGHALPPHGSVLDGRSLVSSGRNVTIRFVSGPAYQLQGWSMRVNWTAACHPPPVLPFCDGAMATARGAGVIRSTREGADTYEVSTSCTWMLTADAGMCLELEWLSFRTERMYDSVLVDDTVGSGPATTFVPVAVLSGDLSGPGEGAVIRSTSPVLRVRFSSDGTIAFSGFVAAYRSVSCNATQADVAGCAAYATCTSCRASHLLNCEWCAGDGGGSCAGRGVCAAADVWPPDRVCANQHEALFALRDHLYFGWHLPPLSVGMHRFALCQLGAFECDDAQDVVDFKMYPGTPHGRKVTLLPDVWDAFPLITTFYCHVDGEFSLPPSFFRLPLRSVQLMGFELIGGLPPAMANMSTLWQVYLEDLRIPPSPVPEWLRTLRPESLVLLGLPLVGTIPHWLCDMEIDELALKRMPITGTIPECLGEHVKKLSLSELELSGAIPSSLYTSTSLFELDLSRSKNLVGTLEPVSRSSSIRILQLSHLPKLTGRIPDHAWHSDLDLFLDHTGVTGPLPASILLTANLDLSHTALNCRLPDLTPSQVPLFWAPSSKVVAMSSCGLHGPVPPWLLNLEPPAEDVEFDFSHNQLEGPLPRIIGGLVKMNLAHNRFTGTLVDYSSCIEVDLSHNELTGPLLARHFTQVIRLDVSHNALNGTLDDFFRGAVRERMSHSTSHRLYLSHNRFSGSLPGNITTGIQAPPVVIDVSHNALVGTVPSDFRVNSGGTLLVNDNQLSGPLWEGACSATVLDVSNNTFTGTLPCKRSTMLWQTARLSHNELSGPLHDELLRGISLRTIDLSFNAFSGSVPPLPPTLHTFVGAHNAFSSLPCHALSSSLQEIDLSFNPIETISRGECTPSPLRLLHLRSSPVHHVPGDWFDHLPEVAPNLQVLDLSHSNFSAPMPAAWDALDQLRMLRVRNANVRVPEDADCARDEALCVPAFLTHGPRVWSSSGLTTCASLVPRDARLLIDIDWSDYFRGSLCECVRGYLREGERCTPCPAHGVCPGGAAAHTASAQPGYWGPPIDTLAAPLCDARDAHFVRCHITPLRCAPAPGVGCTRGYTGRMCAQCEDGFFGYAERCTRCPDDAAVGAAMWAWCAGVAGVLVLFFTVHSLEYATVVKSGVLFAQMAAALGYVGVSLPGVVRAVALVQSPLLLFVPPALACTTPHDMLLVDLVVAVCALPVLLAAVALVWALGRIFPRIASHAWGDRCAHVGVMVAWWSWFPALLACLRVLNTLEHDECRGTRFFGVAPYLAASSPHGRRMHDAAAALFTLYLVVVPAVLALLVLHGRSRAAGNHVRDRRVAWLYGEYKPGLWWWEGVGSVVRVLVALALSLRRYGSPGSPFFVFLALFIAAVLQRRWKPCAHSFRNSIVYAQLLLLAVTYTVIMSFFTTHFSAAVDTAVGVFVLALHAGFFVLLLGVGARWVRSGRTSLRSKTGAMASPLLTDLQLQPQGRE